MSVVRVNHVGFPFFPTACSLMAQTFRPEFLRRTMHEVLSYGYTEELMTLYNSEAYNDPDNLRMIIDKCKESYDPDKTVLPFLYNQCGSDQYPFEVVKVYRKPDNTPSMIVIRAMEWTHGVYDETSEVTGSNLNGSIKILKKNRKGAWVEVGDYYKSRYIECPLPICYYDPNF